MKIKTDVDGFDWIRVRGRYVRAIAGGGSGGGKTTVTTQVPPKSAEELELIRKQNDILDIQISELRRQNDALVAIFPDQQKLLAAQTEAAIAFAQFQKEQIPIARAQGELQQKLIGKALEEIEGTPESREIKKLSEQRTLALLKGEAPPLLPGQQARIDTVFNRAGEQARTGLNQFAEELAASRGLRVTDSPIGNEVLRQGRELAADLAAKKAAAELDVGSSEQRFTEAVSQFQANLRQQAFQNRLALTGRSALPTGPGMQPMFSGGSASGAFSSAGGILDSLSRDRLGQASQTTRSPGADLTGTYIGAGAGLVGAGISAYATYAGLAAAAAASSARFKKAIIPYDADEYDRALAKINDTPITRWKYTHEPESQRPHTGPILETAPDDIKLGDTHVDLISYAGLLHAALRAVDRKVDRFADALGVR